MTTYRIFVVEDHSLLQRQYGVLLGLEPDMQVCGIASSGAQALAQIPAAAPDLVILDLSLPDMDGFELMKGLRELCPNLPLLVVSCHAAVHFAAQARKAGASGYVDKMEIADQLVPSIRSALANRES